MVLWTDTVLNRGQKIVINVCLPEHRVVSMTTSVLKVEKKQGRVVHGLLITHSDFTTQRWLKKALLGLQDYFANAA